MTIPIATITALFTLLRNAAGFIPKFTQAKTDEERKAVINDLYDALAEVRRTVNTLLTGTKLTPQQMSEALAQITAGEQDFETQFDNSPSKVTPPVPPAPPIIDHPAPPVPAPPPPAPLPTDELSTFPTLTLAIAEAQRRNTNAGAPLYDVLVTFNGKFFVHRTNQPSGGVQPVWPR